MVDESLDETPTSSIVIDREEAWNIISNQIEVQEQLRTRGQQILSILAAIAVVIAGLSFSLDFSVPESLVEDTVASTSISEADLWTILNWNQVTAIFLLILSALLIIAFIIRNYKVSRHSSLKPGLGENGTASIFVVTNNDYLLRARH